MGITIHYRGTIDDMSQVETMEDRILDLVYSLGGRGTMWRSFAEHDSSRVVRGLMVDLEPGQDTFSLLISPEGHLTPLFQIEDAENEPFDEPPYCFVKTQFGSLQGHIAIVHLLDALRHRFCSNLEVSDEGEYFENRDVNQLTQKMRLLRSAIDSLAVGLEEYGLSPEAAEDPNILATRIERIAALVKQKIFADRSESSGEVDNQKSKCWEEPSLDEEVDAMDRLRRQSELRSERMTRRIAEATASGLSTDEAFELALEEEGLAFPTRDADDPCADEPCADDPCDCEPSEPWTESLPSHPFDEPSERPRGCNQPVVVQAQAFLMQVMNLKQSDSKQSSYLSILVRASMDMFGGIVQATSGELLNNIDRALAITQLKRALSGHAYARGAIFGLRNEEAITEDQSQQLHEQLESLLEAIHGLTEAAWS